ncbi:HI1506-related protein [Yersinia enterocolitica]
MPIQITAKRDGFRRCGMAHSDKTQTYADGHFSPSVLAELQAETMLVVSYVPEGQQDHVEQDKAWAEAQARFQELVVRNKELETGLQQLSEDADALKLANEHANITIADQLLEIDALKAQEASLTPAPDTASKEPADTKTTKATK